MYYGNFSEDNDPDVCRKTKTIKLHAPNRRGISPQETFTAYSYNTYDEELPGIAKAFPDYKFIVHSVGAMCDVQGTRRVIQHSDDPEVNIDYENYHPHIDLIEWTNFPAHIADNGYAVFGSQTLYFLKWYGLNHHPLDEFKPTTLQAHTLDMLMTMGLRVKP